MHMLQKVLHFIKYNNAVTIILVMCFSGFGVAYAASPTVRDSVYSSQEVVVSVDNTAIVAADLDNFNFNLKINSVTEDDKNYYVAYSYQTLAIGDSVWQIEEMDKTLTVNKETLDGKDLGLYAAKQLGDNMDYELSYLKRVQKIEQEKGVSEKVVTTEYSGLVGKLLNPKENVIEGYNPVIPVPVPETPVTEPSNPEPVVVPPVNSEPQINPTPEPVVQPQTEPAPEATSTATTTPATEPAPDSTATSTPVSDQAATSTPPSDQTASTSASTTDSTSTATTTQTSDSL
jgi:hypothetical protein